MKNKALILLVLSFFFFSNSCKKKAEEQKKDGTEQQDRGIVVNDPAPTSFTQKVLVEEFTGEWCGYCPDGARILRILKQNHPDLVYAIGNHDGDPFETTTTSFYISKFNVAFFPSGTVQRSKQNGEYAIGRYDWESVVNSKLAETAQVGLKIETTLNGNMLNIKVKYAGTQDIDSRLTVSIIEDDVPESSPGAQSGAATGYKHPDLFRKTASDKRGDYTVIKANTVKMMTYDNIDLSGYNINNVYIVCFFNNSIDGSDKSILNVQQVKAGDTKDFD